MRFPSDDVLKPSMPLALPPRPISSLRWNHDSAHLLQRTQHVLDADPQYWTAYDVIMIEREARALRSAHLAGSMAAGWRRLVKRARQFCSANDRG